MEGIIKFHFDEISKIENIEFSFNVAVDSILVALIVVLHGLLLFLTNWKSKKKWTK